MNGDLLRDHRIALQPVVDLEQVLIHLISESNGSASAFVIGREQAMTRRRLMFGKVSSSLTPSRSSKMLNFSYRAIDFSIIWLIVISRKRILKKSHGSSHFESTFWRYPTLRSWRYCVVVE